jgi:hypothetical protein
MRSKHSHSSHKLEISPRHRPTNHSLTEPCRHVVNARTRHNNRLNANQLIARQVIFNPFMSEQLIFKQLTARFCYLYENIRVYDLLYVRIQFCYIFKLADLTLKINYRVLDNRLLQTGLLHRRGH